MQQFFMHFVQLVSVYVKSHFIVLCNYNRKYVNITQKLKVSVLFDLLPLSSGCLVLYLFLACLFRLLYIIYSVFIYFVNS